VENYNTKLCIECIECKYNTFFIFSRYPPSAEKIFYILVTERKTGLNMDRFAPTLDGELDSLFRCAGSHLRFSALTISLPF